jgi:hypothetical protein
MVCVSTLQNMRGCRAQAMRRYGGRNPSIGFPDLVAVGLVGRSSRIVRFPSAARRIVRCRSVSQTFWRLEV